MTKNNGSTVFSNCWMNCDQSAGTISFDTWGSKGRHFFCFVEREENWLGGNRSKTRKKDERDHENGVQKVIGNGENSNITLKGCVVQMRA